MPLFSPSLHGIAGMPTVTDGDGVNDKIVFFDASTGRAVSAKLARHAQEECYIFSSNGLTADHPAQTNFSPQAATPKIDMRWPYDWICTGIRSTVSGRPASGTAAGINIIREANSIFNDTTTISTSHAQISTGAGNLYTSLISPHANHVNWTKGDRVRMYIVAGASGSGSQGNNFHGLKFMLYGYRR